MSEFGMGMKSASCWFAPSWTVRTKALADSVERRVEFDIQKIVHDQIEELDVIETPVGQRTPYTIIELHDCRSVPTGRTLGKIREHLGDIYRDFLRAGELQLIVKGEQLGVSEPEVLRSQSYDTNNEPSGDTLEWRKDIDFDFGNGMRVQGFAGLLKTGSTSSAGFMLFRRRRVIQGSGDEKYRPQLIFGSSNTYIYQRLFGELHLTGFEVSHTKDGFRWDDNEEPFLNLLREHLDSDELPLLRQARNYRERVSRARVERIASQAADATAAAMQQHLAAGIEEARAIPVPPPPPPANMPEAELAGSRVIDVDVDGEQWRIVLEISTSPSDKWLDIADAVTGGIDGGNRRLLGLRLSLEHVFMKRLVRMDRSHIEPLLRVAAGLGLAERLADDAGGNYPAMVRLAFNKLMKGPLAAPGNAEET